MLRAEAIPFILINEKKDNNNKVTYEFQLQRKAIDISKATYLVLDEADEMLGVLKEGLDQIVQELPGPRRIPDKPCQSVG